MFEAEFIEEFAEILEVDPEDLNADFSLTEETWSSLVLLSTIAIIDDYFDKTLKPDRIVETRSLQDLYTLVTKA